MLDMARKAIGKTQSISRDNYDQNEDLRLALTHLVQIIGEAASNVSRECDPEFTSSLGAGPHGQLPSGSSCVTVRATHEGQRRMK